MNEEIESKISPILESLNLALYDTEIVKEADSLIYRIYVTKEGGVALDNIVEATKQISPILDVYPPVSGEYRLEVSSPGVERNLKKIEHFQKSIGEQVQLKLKDKTKVKGTLLEVNGNNIAIEVKGEKEIYNLEAISKAKTVFDW